MNRVCASAPLRLSLAGGGTDLPEYSTRFGAELLAAALTLRVRVEVAPRADGLLLHAGTHCPVTSAPGLVGAIVRRIHPLGAEVTITSDIEPESGLGGSGALGTALAAGLSRATGAPMTPLEAAMLAVRVEREELGARIGPQDQVVAASGGLVRVQITKQGALTVSRDPELAASVCWLCEGAMLLFDTGVRRKAVAVLAPVAAGLESGEAIIVEKARANAALLPTIEAAIRGRDVARLGSAMHEHWTNKRALSPGMSTDRIDEVYAAARDAGALGGKLIGAGGGGCLLFVARRERHPDLVTVARKCGMRRERLALDDRGLQLEMKTRE